MKQSQLKSFCRTSGAGPTDVAFSKSSTPPADAPAGMMFGTAQAAPQSNQIQNPPKRWGRLQTTVLAQNLRRLIPTCEIFALVGIGLFNWSSTARAAYPLVVDDAGVHSPGTADLDFFADGQRTPTSENIGANFLGTVGLFPRLEGWVGVGYGWVRDRSPENAPTQDGLLDVNVGLKGSIVPEDAGPLAVSLSVNAKLPTADDNLGLGTGFTDLSVNAIGT